MTTSNPIAIQFENVTKVYKLFHSRFEQIKDFLGFSATGEEFVALKNINLTIKQGQRIAIIGRNGAGKSTLLKMITGNFAPTQGLVTVKGSVQALMDMGYGFHPEFTGYENLKHALLYTGLKSDQLQAAIDDVVDFVELGDFIHHPLKTYSMGMRSRLYFAVATAIQPEILIVDEVLGAGDAYFSAKSADRMKKLTQSGCTLLLVSHSTAQVLQFCDEAIWLEAGEVVLQGSALSVIKAYEEFSKKLEMQYVENHANTLDKPVIQSKWLREKMLSEVLQNSSQASMSRWPSQEKGLKIVEVEVTNGHNQKVSVLNSGEPAHIRIKMKAEFSGEFPYVVAIVIFSEDGRWVTRICSELFHYHLKEGQIIVANFVMENILLGNGNYVLSPSVYKHLDLSDTSTARYYDLLSRSFEFSVRTRYPDDTSVFEHPGRWQVELLDNPSEVVPA